VSAVRRAPTTSEGGGQTVATIERALDVLNLFGEADGHTLGVTEIANELDLSKAVVHRILSSFRAKGFVEADDETRRYRLGPRVLYLGLAYMEGIDVRAMARPVLEELSRATNETATLSVRTGDARVYIDQVTPPRDVKMVVQLGRQVPLHAGASSKAMLAFLDPAEVDAYLSGPLPKLGPRTVTTVKQLRKELAEVRERGFAASSEERMEGAGSVAAPVLGADGRPAAVISVCGPVERFRDEAEEAARRLVAATGALSEQLGYRGPRPRPASRGASASPRP
jgi:DNA-binding IclR family transcriptional regulator